MLQGKLARRLQALWHRGRMQRDLEEEMLAHREMMAEERRPHFGSTLRLREEAGDQWGWTWLDHLSQDLRYGMRSLRRSPGFACAAIAVLAVGIGVNLAELHVFNALLHRLQVRDVTSLVRFFRITSAHTSSTFSLPEIDFYRRQNSTLSAVIAETDVPGVFLDSDSDNLACSMVSANFFEELGVAAAYGRVLDARDDLAGAQPAAVLAYAYWQSRFGGDPGVVGRTIRLNTRPVQVVGIAGPQFAGLVRQPTQLWMSASQYAYLAGGHDTQDSFAVEHTYLLGRLQPGISQSAAEAQFRVLREELFRQQPRNFEADERIKIQPAEVPPNPTPAAVLLFTTLVLLVLLVLLSACANLGNMLLARGVARRREIEIRLAVGAGRARLVRQLMTENLLLAGIASVVALWVGRLAARLLLRMIDAPPALRIVTDWRIVGACAALGLLATCAFGLTPAFHAVRSGPAASRARRVLVSVQVAVSCLLLILSSFFTRAIQHTFQTAVPADFSRMAVVDPAFYLHHYTAPQARQAAFDLAARVRQAPGVDSTSVATIVPLQRSWIEHVDSQEVYLNEVEPSYFTMMRLPLVQGRLFTSGEADVVMLSESAARRLFPGASPVGRTCEIARRKRTVAGIVPDSGLNLIANPQSVEAYFPIDDQNAVYATVLVHAAHRDSLSPGAIRSAAMLPGIVPSVSTFQRSFDKKLESMRQSGAVIASLGTVASLVALLGIAGLLAFTVAQRSREIGLRLALGARARDVVRCVVGQYAVPFGLGIGGGALLAAAAARIVRTVLWGFQPLDLLSLGAGLGLFAAVALAASIAPVCRALRIDPATTIRHEAQ